MSGLPRAQDTTCCKPRCGPALSSATSGRAQDRSPLRRPQGLRNLSPAGQPNAGGRHYPTPAGAQQGFHPQSGAVPRPPVPRKGHSAWGELHQSGDPQTPSDLPSIQFMTGPVSGRRSGHPGFRPVQQVTVLPPTARRQCISRTTPRSRDRRTSEVLVLQAKIFVLPTPA